MFLPVVKKKQINCLGGEQEIQHEIKQINFLKKTKHIFRKCCSVN